MAQESNMTTECNEAVTNLTLGQAEEKEQTKDDTTNMHDRDVCDSENETDGFQPKDAKEFESSSKDHPLNISKKSFLDSECKMKNYDQNNVRHFKCPSLNCNLSFENFSKLKLHAYNKHNHRLNATHMRVYQVQRRNSVKSLETSDGNKVINGWHTCGLCGRKFKTKEKRDHHEANHSKMRFKCSCGFLFLKSPSFKSHLQYVHNSATEVQKVNHRVELYKCPVNQCGTLYEHFHEFISHTIGYHGTRLTKEGRKLCRINENACNKETTNDFSGDASQMRNQNKESEDSLRADSKKQKNSKKNKLTNNLPQCDLCKRRFMKKEKRDYHVLHHDEMTYRCPVKKCEQLFEVFLNLRQHCVAHHNFLLRTCEKEAYELNQTKNKAICINGITVLEEDTIAPSLGTDSDNFGKEFAESYTNTNDVRGDNVKVDSSLSNEEIIIINDDDDGADNIIDRNQNKIHSCRNETHETVTVLQKRNADVPDHAVDPTCTDNFQINDNNRQCNVDNLQMELNAQEPTSNSILDDFSQVMTDFILDNETALTLNSEDESTERSFQMLESVIQTEVSSSQVENTPQDTLVEPSNSISTHREKILENNSKGGEIQSRSPSNCGYDAVEDAVPEKRRRLNEPENNHLVGNTSSSSNQTAVDNDDSEVDKYFCRHVIISNLGKLSGERKSVAKLNIHAILHNVEFGASIELLDVPKVNNNEGQRANSSAELDNIFCVTTIIPVLRRLSDERKSWAKVEIHRILHDARFVDKELL